MRADPPDTRVFHRESSRFRQEIARIQRTSKKIQRTLKGTGLGISGIQCPVDRAQACPSKHPDGYREVPF